eukprot:c1550_g1_i1.p1 GENE.c1550_g1_i1~~c1550_g1_i1.p1  ORF type:complete len:453 (+),score=61.32 c1550_g1_i1:1049-2407(+)
MGLLEISCVYAVHSLREACCLAIRTTMTEDSVWVVMEAAMRLDMPQLVDHALDCAILNFDKIISEPTSEFSTGFLAASEATVRKLLSSPDISVSESQVFEAAIRWLSHLPSRQSTAHKILGLVRFRLMPSQFVERNRTHTLTQSPAVQLCMSEALIQGTQLRDRPRNLFPCRFEETRSFSHDGGTVQVMVVVDQFLVCGTSDGKILVWDSESWALVAQLRQHTGSVLCMAVLDSNTLISGSRDTSVKVWDTSTWSCLRTLTEHATGVRSVATSRIDNIVITGAHDSVIKVWDTRTWTCTRTITDHNGAVCALAVAFNHFFTGSSETPVKVRNLSTWECDATLTEYTDWVYALLVSGNRLVAGSHNGTIKVWDVVNWEFQRTLNEHQGGVRALAVAGSKLISGSYDKTIKVWDTTTWQCVRTLASHRSAVRAVAVCGAKLISASNDGIIKVWE